MTGLIADGESGATARAKINETITKGNTGATWAQIAAAVDGESGDDTEVVLGDGTIGPVPGGGGGAYATVISITTGGSPIVITPDPAGTAALTVYEITSGGTGDEYIHLLKYASTPEGGDFGAPDQVAKRFQFVMVDQTDGGDVVHVQLYASDGLGSPEDQYVTNTLGAHIGQVTDSTVGGVLDYVGAPLIYVWNYDFWAFDNGSIDQNSSTDIQFNQYPEANGYSNSGSGFAANIRAGSAKSGSDEAGGEAGLRGGDGDDTSDGGDVNIVSGNGGATSGSGGDITITLGAGAGVDGHFKMALEDFADDTAAAAGGVPLTGWYRTGNAPKVRIV